MPSLARYQRPGAVYASAPITRIGVAARARARQRLGLVIDPRFPGGTSAAVAAEIRALAAHVDLEVIGLETEMFRGRRVAPVLQAALDACGLSVRWQPPVVRADTVVVHNPSCLRFDHGLAMRISASRLVVVTHENLVRPSGSEAFDVARCLDLVAAATVAGARWLAPVSAVNRRSVAAWRSAAGDRGWAVTPFDWFNICDLPLRPPVRAPRDRRGRHSRPGPEKFPPHEVMLRHFPAHAERVVILGGDGLAAGETLPAHWDVRRFGETEVGDFLDEIDFAVYFTNPLWQDSFGRAVAEAIAAGKVVITDPATAETFGPAVVASDGDDVDAIVAGFVAAPDRYAAFVESAQAWLAGLGPERFRARVLAGLEALREPADALL